MSTPRVYDCSLSGRLANPVTLIIALVIAVMVATGSAHAQTFQVIYSFTGGADGYVPSGALVLDSTGNLYGTTNGGGNGHGTVFKLSNRNHGSIWKLNTLYSFAGGTDGDGPYAGVTFGHDGTLYGTTADQGNRGCGGYGCGTVFNLKPPTKPCRSSLLCPWTETILYQFMGGTDGGNPIADVAFDQAGNLYGTTAYGGPNGNGTVYELTPSNGVWSEALLHAFSFAPDGIEPAAGVTVAKTGDLFGTTLDGGSHFFGTIFRLTHSNSGWTEDVLHSFDPTSFDPNSDGGFPTGLISDRLGNLYGATYTGGPGGGGTVFELSPSDGSWQFSLLYSFTGPGESGPYPFAGRLAIDSGGNLYGTTYRGGGQGCGTVFKLTPSSGTWTQTVLHEFTCTEGFYPIGSVVLDKNGNIFGAASQGGVNNSGVVWEITP